MSAPVTITDECPLSQRVDGKGHTWRWDGDDPRIICVWCDEMRDALSGIVYRPGRKPPLDAPDSSVSDEGGA